MSALAELKILDFSTLLPGPFGTLLLADMGADVIRVEAPNRHELTRDIGAKDGDASYVHRYLNRSKRSLGLNLKCPQAIEVIRDLINDYDIIVEQFRPGVMDKLGLGYETLKAINPRLIYCSLSGYGQTGPYRDRAGHDNNYLSIAGVIDHGRRQGEKPCPSGVQIADIAGGSMHLVAGLLAAVIQRQSTGEGQLVDISITDATFTLNALSSSDCLNTEHDAEPEQSLLNGGSFYDFYETSDGRYFSVGSLEPQFRIAICTALEAPQLTSLALSPKPADQQAFKEQLGVHFKALTFVQCQAIFSQADACVEPVLSLSEACEHEQLVSREMIVEVDGIQQPGCAIKMSASKPSFQFKGCSLGEHNDLLASQLDYSEQKIQELQDAGVFGE